MSLVRVFNTIAARMTNVPVHLVDDNLEVAERISAALDSIFRRGAESRVPGEAIDKEQRKVLKRSLRAAEAFVPAETVTAFLNKKEVTVTGKNLVLKAIRTGKLTSKGHGAFSVSVCTKDSVFLARLCVYFDNTPVLDQLIGMVLFVLSGCEEEFIRKGNVVYLSSEGSKHPLFERDAKRVEELRESFKHKPWTGISYDDQRARSKAYWDATGVMWTEELSMYLLGRRCCSVLINQG
jgi:hypothetical protein